MKNVASFAFLALLFCAASASWDSLDSIQHHSSDLDIVNEDIIPRLLQEVLGDAGVPGAYGDSAPTDATEEDSCAPCCSCHYPCGDSHHQPGYPRHRDPVTETDVTETDVTETPVTETDVTETPITETPVTETDITETDVTETPVTETPVTETPVTETAITETDVTETDVTETPLTETPVTETATTETPVTETSITPVVQPTQPTVVETPTPAVDSAADTTPAWRP
ncbi:hypothetical protein COO60DRAFT_143903 [Scenedesmus sp. NREL 46B-D3]|nr:hypothetical protein COO60DRAFT_143903 [Scenedesmus sp. NREL 46B-D3]